MHKKLVLSLPERLFTVGFKLVIYFCNCHIFNCYRILCDICGWLVSIFNTYACTHILSSWKEGCWQSYIEWYFLSQNEFLTQVKCSYYEFGFFTPAFALLVFSETGYRSNSWQIIPSNTFLFHLFLAVAVYNLGVH